MWLKKIINSPSKSFATIMAIFCFGILFGPLFLFIEINFFISIFSLLISLLVLNKNRIYGFLLIIIFIFLFGVFRYTQSEVPNHITNVSEKIGRPVSIEGVVSTNVEDTINNKRIIIDDVSIVGKKTFGKILVTAPLYVGAEYKDKISFTCRLKMPEPFNGFRYDKYLESKGILALCHFPKYIDLVEYGEFNIIKVIYSIKQNLTTRLSGLVPAPHSNFLSGLLFGGQSSISKTIQDDFSKTGTSHILAASGFNVAILSVFLLSWILKTRIGRKKGLLLILSMLILYMIIAGATPSVVRATLMGCMLVLQKIVNRKPYTINILLLALSIMLLINPRILLDDVGFQLSFAATIGIMLMTKNWIERFKFLPENFGIRDSFAASMSAIIFTTPILLWHFGALSVVSPMVNLIILPALPFVMSIIIIGLLLSFVSSIVAKIVLLIAWVFSYSILRIISVYASFDFSQIEFSHQKIISVILVVIMGMFCWYKKKYAKKKST